MKEKKKKTKRKSSNLASCPLLPQPNVELVIQQLLIVCPYIYGYGQALQMVIQGSDTD